MQQIVWTETTVAGGKPLTVKLARPYAKRDYYRDAAVIAFPASVGDESHYGDAIASIRASAAVHTATLPDRDLASTTGPTPKTPPGVKMKPPFTDTAEPT